MTVLAQCQGLFQCALEEKKNNNYAVTGVLSFRGQRNLKPHPGLSPFGVSFTFSDKHPHPFHIGPPTRQKCQKDCVW